MKIKLLMFVCFLTTSAFAQIGDFVGEIKIFAGNYAPRNYAFCNGQLLNISSNPALFSLLGTTYGGNGITTFALPDLRERVVIAPGQGSLLSVRDLGETGGSNTVTILSENLPAHTHVADIKISDAVSTASAPNNTLAMGIPRDVYNVSTVTPVIKYNAAIEDVTLSGISTSTDGSAVPVDIEQPYLVCNYIIALQGIFPQRP